MGVFVLNAAVVLVNELERRAAEAQIERDRRFLAWQEAMERANQLATHAHYAAGLNKQADDWRRARELQIYCDALQQRICEAGRQSMPVEDARRSLAWAQQHVAAIDPLQTLLTAPEFAPRPADLEPFLDGWSAHEPEKRLVTGRAGVAGQPAVRASALCRVPNRIAG